MTTRLTISLPEALRKFVDEQVAAGGHSNAGQYVRSLIQAAQNDQEQNDRLASLLEGLASGPGTEVIPEDWQELRAELLRHLELLKANEEKRQQQREDLRRELLVGIEQLKRGEYSIYDDSSLRNLVEEVTAAGRRKLNRKRNSHPA
jgi:antitoxin ParD1/3/4